MSHEFLTTELAVRVMGWRLAPGRYLKADGGWTPRSNFRPLEYIRDAHRMLDAVAADCSVVRKHGQCCTATVHMAGLTGTATGSTEARAISFAVARALGIETASDRYSEAAGAPGGLRGA